MIVGYARTSTPDQHLYIQTDALQQAGCEKILSDQMSGAKENRPGADHLKVFLRPGDMLIIYSLDRLSRSLKDLLEWMNFLSENNIQLKSLREEIDTSTAVGKYTFHMCAAMAEFERNIIRERTTAGLTAARARGRKGGRPKTVEGKKLDQAIQLWKSKKFTIKEITSLCGISPASFYKYFDVKSARESFH